MYSDMTKIELKNVSKVYDERIKAVNNVSFTVEDSEFVVLAGPSGCGKTTILRAIAGLESISSGEIIMNGKVINNISPKDRDIAMVFQNYALYPHLSVYDNMAFGLKLRRFNKEEIDERINEASEILEIKELLDRKPQQLSGGQKQRVALGRAIVRKPKLFLFDEPLSNLDTQLRTTMRIELAHLHKRLKTPMIYVTHDQVEAMTLGNKIVILKNGNLQQIGSPIEVYKKPVNRFVAGFLGSPPMNFIEGIIKDEEEYVFRSVDENILIRFEKNQYGFLHDLRKNFVFIGLRPEAIRINENDSIKGFDAYVDYIEYLGNEAILHFNIEKMNMTAIVSANDMFERNQKIKISFELGSLHFFNH